MPSLSFLVILFFWAFLEPIVNALESWSPTHPLPAKWSSKKIGPDGPWQGVEVIVGGQTLVTYPGRDFYSYFLTEEYCTGSSICYAEDTGLYDQTKGTGSSLSVSFRPGANFTDGLNIDGPGAKVWGDNVNPGDGDVTIPDLSMALISQASVIYPSGAGYQLFAGCLGLGAAGRVNHSFATNSAAAAPFINASLIPGWLQLNNKITSNSFSLHIGSVNPPMSGSLYWGGYDKGRLVGDVLAVPGGIGPVSLIDISIDVVSGGSPFPYKSKAGLLAGNSSISTIAVDIDPCAPYLNLPKSTCDAITADLPVSYNEALGLYIWDTQSQLYEDIIKSASVLKFTFNGESNTKNITISVPFMHLNLTLDKPLVTTPTPYFPCNGASSTYLLGRAFLQDAFIGNNWMADTDAGRGVFFIGQAPGPNIPATPSVALIGPDDLTLAAGENNWEESWNNVWSPMRSGTTDGTTGDITGDNNGGGSGLSKGTIAGIVVAGVAGVAAIVALCLFYILRRKRLSRKGDAGNSRGHSTSEYFKPELPSSSSPKIPTPLAELEAIPVELEAVLVPSHRKSGIN